MATTGETRTSEHAVIRRWAEARGGVPARVCGSSDGAIALRIVFPQQGDFDLEEDVEEISWREFFQAFDQQKLALELALAPDGGDDGKRGQEGQRGERESSLLYEIVPRKTDTPN